MWFLFGITSLFAFTFYFGKKRFESNWTGIPSTTQGIKYVSNTSTDKKKVKFIQLGCSAKGELAMDISIKPETSTDKFFKAIGISVEHQVGRDSFDNDLYIISDHSIVCNALSQSSALQSEISEVVKACKKHAMEFQELHIRNHRIWIKVTPSEKDKVPNVTTIAKDIIPTLSLIAELFRTHVGQSKSTLRDPFYFKAAIFLAISTGMAFTGFTHLLSLSFLNEPFTIEIYELFSVSFILGTVLIGVLIFAMFVFLGKTARTHLVLLELMTIGYFGSVASTFCLARDINIEWDSGSPNVYIVEVYNKTIHRSRRHTSYSVEVDDWLKSGRKNISVSSSKYYDINVGEKLEINQYPGYLGFKWVDELKKYSTSY